MYETIDLLQQTTDYYYIDYIPYNTDDPNFLELEEYFEKQWIHECVHCFFAVVYCKKYAQFTFFTNINVILR